MPASALLDAVAQAREGLLEPPRDLALTEEVDDQTAQAAGRTLARLTVLEPRRLPAALARLPERRRRELLRALGDLAREAERLG